ncbi:DUF58 domain-containing protein [Gemmata sp. JC717]|uniref:DUF58 domain-containing protein n=1 Tax=Gemmata algarum TaxID=2975278 RepID=A0ABU5EYP3_9BACT|nr:DUF58 domain-containing protein [Gemmata algarum]MDY3554049.1 DUF58 domain-containing protein [Gemmata algarum]MDY3559575.1 DUF58 domain-containing protein [Gemmata algarum]
MKRTDGAGGLALQFTPSGITWLAVSLGVGAVAWFKSINLVLIVVYVMLALVVLNGALARRNVAGVRARRLAAPPLFAGERSEHGVRITNEGHAPVTVTVEDRTPAGSVTFLGYRVPPGGALDCKASGEFPTRGRFAGPLTLVSSFPFGFVSYQRHTDSGGEIVVLPRPGQADPDGLRRWVARQAGGEGRARKLLRRVTTDRAEVRGVRAYRAGDPIRDIHWLTTARRGEPMVREYDTAPSPELVLVVEPWLPAEPTPQDYERLEAALSLAVTVAATWRRAFDSPIMVAVPGHAVASASAEEDLREALTPLADAAGGPTHEPLPAAAFAGRLARGARVVVSSRPNSPFSAALARETGKPFATVCPQDRLPWYQPPAAQS